MTTVVVNGQEYQRKNPQFKAWETPPDFFNGLDAEFEFTLDAAASHDNALCRVYCTPEGMFRDNAEMISGLDGLSASWYGHRVYCNPPYDYSIKDWVAKAAKREAEVAVLLLPPSVDTAWFHDYIWGHDVEVRFLRGRLKFWRDGKPGDAPRAGNMLAIFRS